MNTLMVDGPGLGKTLAVELARRVGKRPELAMGYGNGLNIMRPAWWTCRCSACVLQRQEKDYQYRDHAANGQL